jgi:hypothetical protein
LEDVRNDQLHCLLINQISTNDEQGLVFGVIFAEFVDKMKHDRARIDVTCEVLEQFFAVDKLSARRK